MEHLAHTKIEDIFRAFKIVFKLCMQRSFRVTHVSVDGEFAPTKPLMWERPGGPKVNLASANERIRMANEDWRAIIHSLHYNRMPRLLTIWIVFKLGKIDELCPND